MPKRLLLAVAWLAIAPLVSAQSVTLSGMMGSKALLIVDGNPPKLVAPGDSFRDIRVVSTQGDQAVLEIAGKRHTLKVGESPSSVGAGGGNAEGGKRIVLTASSGGHFMTTGQINDNTVQFMVDTGATMVAMSIDEATRMGIKYQTGQRGSVSTANGMAPAWRVKLQSVRIGDVVVYQVDALVSPAPMPFVLLGNSFLSHFQMNRTNDQMVLDKRF